MLALVNVTQLEDNYALKYQVEGKYRLLPYMYVLNAGEKAVCGKLVNPGRRS